MARPRKVPAVLVEATVRGNAKLAALPSDAARLGFFYVVLGEAKLSKPIPGQFASGTQFAEVAGRFAKYLRDYLAVGILEETPRLCERCRTHWASMPPTKGALVVHDWHEYQYDPLRLERQRAYDEAHRAPVSDGVSDPVSSPVSDAQSDGVSDTNLTVISRASAPGPGRRRAANAERRTENDESGTPTSDLDAGANGAVTRQVKGFAKAGDVASALAARSEDWTQALTLAERDEWASFGPEWDAFKAAWLRRGFRHPPSGEADDDPDAPNPSQRALLWSVLDAWPNELAGWITEAPKKLTASQVVGLVIERWHGKRDEGDARADGQDAESAARASRSPSWLPADVL